MKQTNIFQTTVRNKIITTVAAITVFFMVHPICVQAKTLDKAKTALETLQNQLKIIVPLAATVILLCLAIGYAGRYIEKDTFVRWAVGVVIAGSAAELVAMLFQNP
ncbi:MULTISPECIES: VirB2 family type IV secretion system major pilin TrwL [unclassified Bartonella]|uniref:VirB2 family type IV secretion system major pilin TrwL n=1 Tax=unclassified Bartonella TaxID=2645622 RepID=UPI00235E4A44|nr:MULTISPECIES: VirB2 family type IV secretion system major pilin TrwL [unclassified Bartonella]